MAISHMQLLVVSSGLIRIEEASDNSFKLMRSGNVDAYLGHLTENELRDLFDATGDLLTYLDTLQPPVVSEVG